MQEFIAEPEILDKYITNQLSADERIRLEERIASDPDLANLIARLRLEHAMMEVRVEDRLRGQIRQWNGFRRTRRDIRRKRRYWAYGISAALWTAALYWTWQYFYPPAAAEATPQEQPPAQPIAETPDDTFDPGAGPVEEREAGPDEKNLRKMHAIAAAFHETPEMEKIQMRGHGSASPLNQGLAALQTRDYAQAAEYFKKATSDSPEGMDAQYYLGFSLYLLERPNAALAALEAAVSDENYLYHESASWYALLCCLQTGQLERARRLLGPMLADEAHSRHSQALRLSAALKKLQ